MKAPHKKETKKIAYNCRKATFLIEKNKIEPITSREETELKMHLAGCEVCRIFEQQSGIIDQMVHALFHAKETQKPELGEGFKKALQERINKQANKT